MGNVDDVVKRIGKRLGNALFEAHNKEYDEGAIIQQEIEQYRDELLDEINNIIKEHSDKLGSFNVCSKIVEIKQKIASLKSEGGK